MTPRVSTVVIFLNPGRYFEEAIESVLSQDYGDQELLLVDDGSTDGSAEIARGHAEREPERIRYLAHPKGENRGMSASRNLGIGAARGEYLAFLDADDTWLPGKLTRQVAILDSYPDAAMVYGPTLRWYSWDGVTPDEPRELPIEADRVIDPPHLVRWLLQRLAAPAMGSLLARRDAVLEVGGFEDEFRDLYEDQVFHFKMFLRHPVFVSSECWDRYRKHADAATNVAPPEAHDRARLRFLRLVRRTLVESGCRDPEIWWLLRNELRRLPPETERMRARERAASAVLTAASFPRVARARAIVPAAARAAVVRARTRRLSERTLQQARRSGGTTIVTIPTALVSDEYGFSLAPDGWHYLRALLAEYERDPSQEAESSAYFRFFTHERLQAARYLEDVLFFGESAEDGFYFGTYPWGDWTASDARVGGLPFGHHYDAVEGGDTRDLYGYRRNPWYRPGDTYPLAIERRRTIELYRSLREGYRPSLYRTLPTVVLLARSDGAVRAVRHRGHHRLATLAHLGHESVTVELHAESVKVVHESDVERWHYVANGRCAPEHALRIFHAFFDLDGSERAAALGLPKPY